MIDIDADNAKIADIYSLDGRKVSGTNLTDGVYIVRLADGSVRKALKK